MRNHVRFRSEQFAPQHQEPDQVNEERYGYALATWVAARLQERGVTVDAPEPEDWGWMLGAVHGGRGVCFNCGNIDGSISEWLVWIEGRRPGFLSQLLGREAPAGVITDLAGMLDAALRMNPSVGEIEWFRVGARGDEFDHAETPR